MQATATKATAAAPLLDEAMAAMLDRDDAMVAIVLAAAAEDVFQGLLKRAGKAEMAARKQVIPTSVPSSA